MSHQRGNPYGIYISAVFELTRLMGDLYVQEYDGEKVTVQIRSKMLDEIAEAIEKAHSTESEKEE